VRAAIVLTAAIMVGYGCGPSPESSGASASHRLRAFGNEPFWSIAVSADSGIVYTRLGEPGLVFPYASPASTADSTSTLIFGPVTDASGAHQIEGRIEARECADTMADTVHPMRATVVVDDEELSGCARPADDVPGERP